MSIVSNSPRTHHQVSQLKAKWAKEDAAKRSVKVSDSQANRVFGEGIFPVQMKDDGSVQPSFRNSWIWDGVSEEDRLWLIEDNARRKAEQREQDERDSAMAEMDRMDILMAMHLSGRVVEIEEELYV